jgi:hypothetical protein
MEHEECKNDDCFYALAVMNLHYSRDPFKNRMEGKIKDDWICKEKMGHMAPACYELLSKMEQDGVLEDWQIQLKTVFKEMM